MKLAFFLALIIASINSFAQQPPKSKPLPKALQHHNDQITTSIPHGELQQSQPSNEELSTLLRAQTEAIKSLYNKLDSLEARIDKIEKGGASGK